MFVKMFIFQGQLGGFLDVLQERSLKIEGFVSEIEALFNSLEVCVDSVFHIMQQLPLFREQRFVPFLTLFS